MPHKQCLNFYNLSPGGDRVTVVHGSNNTNCKSQAQLYSYYYI